MANETTKTNESSKTSEPKDSKDSRTPIEKLREASTTEEETEVFEEAAKARVTTPDGQEGAPVPGDLGMRAEYWKH